MSEGLAISVYERLGLDPERPASATTIVLGVYGTRPRFVARLRREACRVKINGETFVYARASLSEERKRYALLHEVGHAFVAGEDAKAEAACSELAARLAVPLPAYRKMRAQVGHSVYDIAYAFGVTHAMAMLRIGEADGRPVRLLGGDAQREIVRGEPFDWGCVRSALSGRHRHRVHPIRLRDEKRVGLMAAA